MDVFETAMSIAHEALGDVKDKQGKPAIRHTIEVMRRLPTPDLQLVGILHDVVEDSEKTIEDLRAAGVREDILAAVDAITKRPSESYKKYIERVKLNKLARQVKVADISHNMSIPRLFHLEEKEVVRLTKKYYKAYQILRR